MNKYEVHVTQDLRGWYNGVIEIEASSEKAALNKLEKMSPLDIDRLADWTHGDEYIGDISTIEIDKESITQINTYGKNKSVL